MGLMATGKTFYLVELSLGSRRDVFDSQMKPAWTTPAAIQATKDYIEMHTLTTSVVRVLFRT